MNTKKGRVKDRIMREGSDVPILCVDPANPYHGMLSPAGLSLHDMDAIPVPTKRWVRVDAAL